MEIGKRIKSGETKEIIVKLKKLNTLLNATGYILMFYFKMINLQRYIYRNLIRIMQAPIGKHILSEKRIWT